MDFSEKVLKARKNKDWSDVIAEISACEDLNEIISPGGWRLRVLINYKAPIEVISLALERGADVNFQLQGNPPAIFYVAAEHLDIVKLLLKAGADVNIKDYQGNTIFTAKPHHDLAFYRLIGDHNYDFSFKSKYEEYNMLHYAVQSNHWDYKLAEYIVAKCKEQNLIGLLNERNAEGFTPLHFAVDFAVPEIVKLYIENGADPTIAIKMNFPSRSNPDLIYSKGINAEEMLKAQRRIFNEARSKGTNVHDDDTRIKHLEQLFNH